MSILTTACLDVSRKMEIAWHNGQANFYYAIRHAVWEVCNRIQLGLLKMTTVDCRHLYRYLIQIKDEEGFHPHLLQGKSSTLINRTNWSQSDPECEDVQQIRVVLHLCSSFVEFGIHKAKCWPQVKTVLCVSCSKWRCLHQYQLWLI